jgi:hypothetical protein
MGIKTEAWQNLKPEFGKQLAWLRQIVGKEVK